MFVRRRERKKREGWRGVGRSVVEKRERESESLISRQNCRGIILEGSDEAGSAAETGRSRGSKREPAQIDPADLT